MKNEFDDVRNPDLDTINRALVEKFGTEAYAKAREKAKFKHEIARAFRQRRIEKQMDQKELAQKLHTTQQQMSRYEVGENSPTIERLYDMCTMLDLELIIRDKDDGREFYRTK